MWTIFDQLDFHAASASAKPAIILPDRFITYGMLSSGVASVQHVISTFSLDRNRPIGLLVDSPGRHIIIFLALLRSGYTIASLRSEQVEHGLACGVNTVITDRKLPARPDLRTLAVDEAWFVQDCRRLQPAGFPDERIARIVFTSGSTGAPKPIGWSFATLYRRLTNTYLSSSGAQRFLTTYGLSSVGLAYSLRTLLAGNTIHFAPTDLALVSIMNYGVEEVRASVAQLRALVSANDSLRYPIRLRTISTGGGPLTPDFAEQLEHMFKAEIVNTYNSTEAGAMGLACGDILRKRRAKGNCFLPVNRIEIVDERASPIATGVEGRIRVQSSTMGWAFGGSLVETEAARGDGWFYPGDVGFIDEDGLLIITGRSDEVINVGGVKFTPELLEDHLRRHPMVSDVGVTRMAADGGGSQPWAAVVATGDADVTTLNGWLDRTLGGELSVARLSRVIAVDSIPRTGSGKIARAALRDLLKAKVGCRTRPPDRLGPQLPLLSSGGAAAQPEGV